MGGSTDNMFSSSKNSHFRLIHLNELVTGQSKDYIFGRAEQFNEKWELKFNNYYVCITGLKKEIYSGVFSKSAKEYMDIYVPLEMEIREYLGKCGYEYEVFMFCYFNTKQIVIIFEPKENVGVSAEEVAKYITDLIQRTYEEKIFYGSKRYCNFTALSPLLEDYQQLAPTFKRIQQLYDYSFFYMQPIVMDEKLYKKLKREFSYREALELLVNINNAVTLGNTERVSHLTEELFLNKLKYAFDFTLSQDVISEIKKQVYRYSTIFDLNLDKKAGALKVEGYSTIEELYIEAYQLLMLCVKAAAEKGKGIGYISQQAIRYIKEHYTQDICQSDVAEYVNVAPEHLSRVFNNEVGNSIPAYITALRIERSKDLLANSNLKIFEVAKKVGFKDSRYFGQIFKRYVEITPTEYRSKTRKYSLD